MRLILLLALALSLSACILPPVNRTSVEPLSVRPVEIDRYAGLWYEVARFPNNFEEDCEGVTAEYRKRDDGRIDVINTCREGAANGPARAQQGIARIADTQTNAKLKVRFGFPIEGDYWVLDHADDYSWSLVGEPRGRFLWVLSRTPTIGDALRGDLIQRLRMRGYNTDALHWTQQPPG